MIILLVRVVAHGRGYARSSLVERDMISTGIRMGYGGYCRASQARKAGSCSR